MEELVNSVYLLFVCLNFKHFHRHRTASAGKWKHSIWHCLVLKSLKRNLCKCLPKVKKWIYLFIYSKENVSNICKHICKYVCCQFVRHIFKTLFFKKLSKHKMSETKTKRNDGLSDGRVNYRNEVKNSTQSIVTISMIF